MALDADCSSIASRWAAVTLPESGKLNGGHFDGQHRALTPSSVPVLPGSCRCAVLAVPIFAVFVNQISALPEKTESCNRLYFVGVPGYAP